MACGGRGSPMSDTELRDRLSELGVSPGPITDSTRSLYEHKLWTLTQNRSKIQPKTLRLASSDGPDGSPGPVTAARSRSKHTQPRSPTSDANTTAADHDHKVDHTPSSSSLPVASGPLANEAISSPTNTALSPQIMAGNMALSVVEQMLISFNKPGHLANDTAFIFPNGQLLFASRSILAIQCPRMTQFLFPKEDRFPVNVVTALTGQSATYYVHPSEYVVDLKEKISLSQGYPISELNLIFQDKALINSTTLSSCGVSRALSELTLMLLGGSNTTINTATTFYTSAINPSLSISHLNLGLRLDSLLMGGAPVAPPYLAHRQPLPPHLSHIVHVHDIPYEGFQMLLIYLYSKGLMEPPNLNKIGAYVVCYILGEFFHLPSLSQLCLAHIQSLLTVDSALALVPFAEAINCPLLRELSVGYLKIHHTP